MSGIGRSALSTASLQVVALQAVQEEIECLRRDINVLKKVVAEKEQEMLGIDLSMKHNFLNHAPNNNYHKRSVDELIVYSM